MEAQKKVWEDPQLIVLSRGTPEESVLTHCKFIDPLAIGPTGALQDGCNDINANVCGNCQARSGS
jgi:hypothetical protein